VTAKDAETCTEVSAFTVRHILNACSFHARTPRCTPLLSLTQKHKKSAQNHINKPQMSWDSLLWSNETELELFSRMDQRYARRKKNEA